jgi:hypothetical protein
MPQTTEELFASSEGGAPAFFNKNSQVGDAIEGTVVASKPRESRDPVTMEVKRYNDGNAMMDLVVTLQTTMRQHNDDDGLRRVFVRWRGTDKINLESAVQRAGDRFVRNGAWMRVKYVGLGDPGRGGLSAPKVFEFDYRAPNETEQLMTSSSSANQNVNGKQFSTGGIVPGPNVPASGAVSAARDVQQVAAAVGDERRAAIEKVRKLVAAGFGPDEIAGMVTLSREAIEAIIATV